MPANIGAELQQLPLDYLLSAPLTAAIKAQALAAQTTVDFIEKVGLEEDEAGELKVRTAEFSFVQPIPDPITPGDFVDVESRLTVPILSIVPVPFIRISDLNVSFEFKIRNVQSRSSQLEATSKTETEVSSTFKHTMAGEMSLNIGNLFGAKGNSTTEIENKINTNISASVTYQQTERDMLDRSATFKMTMNAVQDAIPEGLSRVLTILNDAIKAQKK